MSETQDTTRTETEVALEVEGIGKRFDRLQAVDDISFSARRGEILGLLGPNGAGKTTAIRMIMGIFRPDAGHIRFRFREGNGALDKRRIGYLPEERGLYDDTKVLDTLVYLGALKGIPPKEARARALEWLERFEIADWADRAVEKLSKGMRQKVQFVASVLHEPALVVLDEPFGGLDPVNQDLFKSVIRELRDGGMAVLLSAHQMNVVEELCDRIFLINHGRRVLYGPLDEVKARHGGYLVHLRFGGDGGWLGENGSLQELQIDGDRARFALPPEADPDAFLRSLPNAIKVRELRLERPPLHDLFVRAVKEEVRELA